MNKYLLVGLVGVIALSTYFFGRLQSLDEAKTTNPEVKSVDDSLPTSTPTVTKTPPAVNKNVQQNISNPTTIPAKPSERKKVQFTTSLEFIAGTYYCYEDGVNELVRLNTEATSRKQVMESCVQNAGSASSRCSNDCYANSTDLDSCLTVCVDTKWEACDGEGDLYQKSFDSLTSKINQLCP